MNELGRRLDYKVENGLYSGKIGSIGHDGLWRSPEGEAIVLEVKTTDAYRISIDTIATYRRKLIASGAIGEGSSVLIVVGRQDTGELEAQVRGSKHAWDVRLISAEALSKLVEIKENSDESETARKIRGVLIPVEYTKIDALVDVIFTTATDIETVILESEGKIGLDSEDALDSGPKELTSSSRSPAFTDAHSLQAKRDQIVSSLSGHLGVSLVKKSRATFWSSDHESRIACTLSKRYDTKVPYWYAYHPAWNEFLLESKVGLFVLGCMDLEFAFSIPVSIMQPILPLLNVTETKKTRYWHIHIVEPLLGKFNIVVPNSQKISIDEYKLPLKPQSV